MLKFVVIHVFPLLPHVSWQEPGDEPAEPVQLSSIQVLHKSMDEVEDNMKGNIEGMIRNQEKAEDLLSKSVIMKDTVSPAVRIYPFIIYTPMSRPDSS